MGHTRNRERERECVARIRGQAVKLGALDGAAGGGVSRIEKRALRRGDDGDGVEGEQRGKDHGDLARRAGGERSKCHARRLEARSRKNNYPFRGGRDLEPEASVGIANGDALPYVRRPASCEGDLCR